MTYAIHVTVTNGEAQVTSQTEGNGAPPDGVYTINGSVGGGVSPGQTAESIGITRDDPPGADNKTGVGILRASAAAYVLQQTG